MYDLIEISNENTVSARDLYKFLETTERFSRWIKRMFKYGFEENLDFIGCTKWYALTNQELIDYELTNGRST